MMKLKFASLIFMLNLAVALSQSGWFSTCDKEEYVFTPVSHFRSKWYSTEATYRYESGSSCRYHAIAPPGYFIRATCTIVLDTPAGSTGCPSQRFYVSRDGDKQLRDGEFWCGTASFTRDSIANEMTLAYTSNLNLAGRFECSLQAILITQSNCDCGWNVNVSLSQKLENKRSKFYHSKDKDCEWHWSYNQWILIDSWIVFDCWEANLLWWIDQ